MLGSFVVRTDGAGNVRWRELVGERPHTRIFAVANAPATQQASRASSPFAPELTTDPGVDLELVTTGPTTVNPNQIVEVVTVVTNKGPAAIWSVGVYIEPLAGAEHVSATISFGDCILRGGTAGEDRWEQGRAPRFATR